MINLYDLIQLYLLYCDKEKHLSKHTIKAYRIDLIQFCSYKDDMSISKDDLILYIRHLHETFKLKTIRRCFWDNIDLLKSSHKFSDTFK